MKTLKIGFSAFLLVVLSFVFITSTQAKAGSDYKIPSSIYPQYQYHYFSNDITDIKSKDMSTIRIPKIADVVKFDKKMVK